MSGFNGSGVFSFTYLWANDAANGIPITASRMDTEFADATGGFNLCVTRDGQGSPSADIPWNSHKITGLAVATTAGDALSYGQASTVSAQTVTGDITAARFFSVSGVTSLVQSVATTIYTLPSSGVGTFLITCAIPASDATYSGAAIAQHDSSSTSLVQLINGGGMTLTHSGLNIQATQAQPTTNANWFVMRIS